MTDDPGDLGRDAGKGPDAFRTISEVAQDLGLPQHVLRFWESRFSQIKPIKRGGGRRYYRPADIELLRGIKQLLYGEGYTIRGVQRILREQGGRKIASAAGASPAAAPPREPQFDAPPPSLMSGPAGPELWAPPARRAGPAPEPAPLFDPQPPPASYADPDEAVGAPPREFEPEPAQSGLTEEQAARLSSALSELKACRTLLEKRR